jgi:hypothetical protein
LSFQAFAGTNFRQVGSLQGFVDTVTSDTNISGYLTFGTNGGSTTTTERMRIDSGGNVGIGRTPSYQLDVYRSGTTSTTIASANDSIVNILSVSGSSAGLVGTITSHPLVITTANTERMRITSGGEIGINTSSPTSSIPLTILANSSNAIAQVIRGRSDGIGALLFTDNSGTENGRIDLRTDYAAINITRAAPLVFLTNSAERMRIDSSGNVGIGTSSPSSRLHVAGGADSTIRNVASSGSSWFVGSNASGYILHNESNTPMLFTTNGTERMRIDSSGNLLVGMTTTGGAGVAVFPDLDTGGSINIRKGAAPSGSRFLIFDVSGSQIGSITYNGSGTSYNTSSDYRLKENIAPMSGALAKVAQLKPCTYVWKSTGEESQGFIAHELQEVCPQAVTGEKDAVNEDGSIKPQVIDTSFLDATQTCVIQELQAEVDALKAQIIQ